MRLAAGFSLGFLCAYVLLNGNFKNVFLDKSRNDAVASGDSNSAKNAILNGSVVETTKK